MPSTSHASLSLPLHPTLQTSLTRFKMLSTFRFPMLISHCPQMTRLPSRCINFLSIVLSLNQTLYRPITASKAKSRNQPAMFLTSSRNSSKHLNLVSRQIFVTMLVGLCDVAGQHIMLYLLQRNARPHSAVRIPATRYIFCTFHLFGELTRL